MLTNKQLDRNQAFQKATETEKLPLGVFYVNPEKITFEENVNAYRESEKPLYDCEPYVNRLKALIETFKISN